MWINRKVLSIFLVDYEESIREILHINLVHYYQDQKYSTNKDCSLTTNPTGNSTLYRYKQININSSNRYNVTDVNNKKEVTKS